MGVHELSRDVMPQWDQSMPAPLTKPQMNLAALRNLFRDVCSSLDLTLKEMTGLTHPMRQTETSRALHLVRYKKIPKPAVGITRTAGSVVR